MNHLEFAASESAALKPTDWEYWLATVSNLTGITNLDGDRSEGNPSPDAYCLDELHDWYLAGFGPTAAADQIQRRVRKQAHPDCSSEEQLAEAESYYGVE